MAELETAPVAAAEPTPIPSDMSVEEAVGLWTTRPKQTEQDDAQPSGAAPQELPPRGDNAGAEGLTSETEGVDAAEQLPPIDPPKSWTKEDKDIFKGLPRETQERLAENERHRNSDILRRLQSATEAEKAATAARTAAEQERAKYEAAIPGLLAAQQQQHMRDFADVRTAEDVRKLAETDPVRYISWDASMRAVHAAANEQRVAQARQMQDIGARFEEFKRTNSEKFLDQAPEYKDPVQAPKLRAAARELLTDVGVTDDEFNALMEGKSGISIYDHRLQLVLRDAIRYRQARTAAREPARPNVPPVMRPGTTTTRGEQRATAVQTIQEKLQRTGSIEDAVALYRARNRR